VGGLADGGVLVGGVSIKTFFKRGDGKKRTLEDYREDGVARGPGGGIAG